VDLGFRPDHLLTMKVVLPSSKYPDQVKRAAFYDRMLEKVKALPGVQSAGVTTWLPLTFPGGSNLYLIEGSPEPPPDEIPMAVTRTVSPDYFRTMGTRLLAGRIFSEQDKQDSTGVVIIDEVMAQVSWPGEDPIGKRIRMAFRRQSWFTVVGIV